MSRTVNMIVSVLRKAFAEAAMPALFLLSVTPTFGGSPSSIVYTKHNLSISSAGGIHAASEADVCIFCHAPHGASSEGPLWNHGLSAATYTPYSSTTLKAAVGQPTGSSRLCLSCHDGTVALGMVLSRSTPIAMEPGANTIPAGRTLVGTDLSAHHPVSFTYDASLVSANGELRDPTTLIDAVRLEGGQVQCSSCHDAHNNQFGNFLVKDNAYSSICQDCHVPNNWATSVHATSPATWNATGQNPWPHTTQTTVAANACENCHRPHAAQTPKRLLNFTPDEQNCYSCHSGTVAAKNIAAEFNKGSIHPIAITSGIHDAAEDSINPTRHIACEDCHNPHAARNAPAAAPFAMGALAGVRGVDAAGAPMTAVQNEYELCFRCHGDSADRGPSVVPRQIPQTNTRLEFSLGNTSFHPVEGAGKNSSVPSLILPMTVSSVIYCTDCHNSDQGPNNGGAGPNGPHGSAFAPILERMLLLTDGTAYNPANFALCYKCHSSSVVDSSLPTSWQYHQTHLETDQAACTTCHDSHGSTGSHLINFNTTYVTPASNGQLEYISTGMNHGNCTLMCHGKDHLATPY